MGEMELPDDAWYGVQTARSLQNFDVAGQLLPHAIIHGMVKLKQACARANRRLKLLAPDKADSERIQCAERGQGSVLSFWDPMKL